MKKKTKFDSFLEEEKIKKKLDKLASKMSPEMPGCREQNARLFDYQYFCEGREHLIEPGLMMAWRMDSVRGFECTGTKYFLFLFNSI